ncbi:4-hydroxyphenylpyruvate dioxygenase [Streptomyces cinnamoneus]|uniref:4-hydroxyphenylpyruvate dioxygenase n=1 Tax=Streptomyces cinnamoneus TaxID=53446 RepID=A0A2G1XLS6_STRCJ|nr:4-hydroxyphenylpyruvate dioxygenase [Streptomyces cinnamoneus]PHQ52160.1 4-hydroxyphenylpyruvate dioxygenase [Streptomyces cinnamoneus]PPT16241.1 4-hydroxyphenylpyruvate dioxygenase [Streptomyces cinnamoneus]
MAALDIEYVELYAHDEAATVGYLAGSLGFRRVARAGRPGLETVLLRQGTVQVLVSTGPAAGRFLEEHGDGVADMALRCDDVAGTLASATAAGARELGDAVGGPAVTGFGGVRHTLFPDGPDAATRLPAGRAWTPLSAAAGPVERISVLDHVAVVLEAGTLQDHTEFYERGFGLGRYSGEYVAFGDQAMDSVVVRSASGGITFTLIEPDKKKQAGQIDAFLDKNNGPGVQHLAFLVDEIVPAVHELRGRGVDFLSTPAAYYGLLERRFPEMAGEIADLKGADVLADRDEWGYLLQLFTRSPYARGTLFYELVQRRGSRGFGSSNIRSLYEAIELDRVAAE